VLALAAALGDLTTELRRARTVLWCCLQLGSCDLPSSCIEAAKRSTTLNIPHQPPASTAARDSPFDRFANKLLTSQTGAKHDVDICDDDDDVFAYVSEQLNHGPDVASHLM